MGVRCIVKTVDGYLGTLELTDGATAADVMRAARAQRLFVVPEEVRLDAPVPTGDETIAPGGEARKGGRRERSA